MTRGTGETSICSALRSESQLLRHRLVSLVSFIDFGHWDDLNMFLDAFRDLFPRNHVVQPVDLFQSLRDGHMYQLLNSALLNALLLDQFHNFSNSVRNLQDLHHDNHVLNSLSEICTQRVNMMALLASKATRVILHASSGSCMTSSWKVEKFNTRPMRMR